MKLSYFTSPAEMGAAGGDRCWLSLCLWTITLFASWAMNAAPLAQAQADGGRKKQSGEKPGRGQGEWVIAPIPIKSPAIGAGLEWVAGYVFPFDKQDKASPPSMAGTGGIYTNNGSRGIALGGRLYLKEDKYRLTLAGGHASINADLYGVGKLAGDRGLFVPLNTKGTAFFSESLLQVKKSIYLGVRFQYRNLKLSIDRRNSELPGDFEINPPSQVADIIDAIRDDLFRHRTIALGPRFQVDTRDNTFYPKRGIFFDSGIDLFARALGSKFTYQYYKAAFNKYSSVGDHQVVAFRGMGCAAAGDRVPVYDLCLFGAMNDLRGYSAGRYQDRRMFATQAEYRLVVPKSGFLGRFGLVAFGGFGGVGQRFAEIGVNDLLPAGGGGIRFRLTKKNPINFRIDYGVGKTGGTLSIGVGEAF
jgi:outer membrane protein assembly factor BamA